MPRFRAQIRVVVCCATVGALVGALEPSASAATTTTTTFAAVANARVQQAYPKSNYGGWNLRSQGGPAAIRSYIKFSISGLSGTVTNATLSLVPLNSSSSGFAVHGAVSNSWTEYGITWRNAPKMTSAVSGVGAYGCCARVSADSTPLVRGNGTLTLVVTSTGSTYNEYKNLEWGASVAPELTVTTSSGGSASTYYVSTSGSDTNPGSQAAPWRTIGHAASSAGPGSTVEITAGSYAENVTLSRSGQSGAPITFESYPGDAVSLTSLTVAASNVSFSGVRIAGASGNCVTIAPALVNIRLSGDTITSCGSDGIGFKRPGNPPSSNYTSNVTIVGDTISNTGVTDRYGNDLTIYGNYVTVSRSDLSAAANDAIAAWGDHLTIQQNSIHDIWNSYGGHNDAFQTWTGLNDGAEGNPVTNLVYAQNRTWNVLGSNAHVVMAEGPGHQNWQIFDNLIQNIGDQSMILGVSGDPGIQNVSVYNNTFVSAGANNTMEFNGGTTAKLANNIFYNCTGWGGGVPYYIDSAASVAHGFNLAGGTTTPLHETGAVNANPGFVNSGSDFHLAAGSPAINAGDNGAIVTPPRSQDLDGAPTVGVVDIGAYEYQG